MASLSSAPPSLFFHCLCCHWCYFCRLCHYFRHHRATAHFCSLFPSFLTMSLHKSSFSQVFPSGKSGATFLRMSIVLATCFAFFCLRIHNSRIECLAKTKVITHEGTTSALLSIDSLISTEMKCLGGNRREWYCDDESKRILMITKRKTNRPRRKIILGIFYRPCDMAELAGPGGVEQELRTFFE